MTFVLDQILTCILQKIMRVVRLRNHVFIICVLATIALFLFAAKLQVSNAPEKIDEPVKLSFVASVDEKQERKPVKSELEKSDPEKPEKKPNAQDVVTKGASTRTVSTTTVATETIMSTRMVTTTTSAKPVITTSTAQKVSSTTNGTVAPLSTSSRKAVTVTTSTKSMIANATAHKSAETTIRVNTTKQPEITSTPSWTPPKLKIIKKKFGEKQDTKNPSATKQPQQEQPRQKGQQACRFPELAIDSPALKGFFKNPKPLGCEKVEQNWVYVENGTFYIDEDAVDRHGGEITCDYTNFWRISDDEVKKEKIENFTSGSPILGDFFQIHCNAGDEETYSNVHAGIVPSDDALERAKRKSLPSDALDLNVYMLGFDSLSRLTFMRKLPKTYKYLTESMQAIVLEGYNIVGDGTPQALIPILTGKTEVELPLTRKRFSNANYVNVYPFVWNEFRDAGYTTLYGEDAARIGTFTYRLKGFKDQPTDHYMRTFYMVAESEMKNHKYLCWGNEEHHKTHFQYVEHFWDAYPLDIRKFAFQFHAYLSHDDIDLVAVADDYMVEHMKFFVENGHMNNSIIIFMSDHGHRFAKLRETQQGKLEERLPFFSFAFPPWFAEKYPETIRVFKQNARRLSTPFDIHATLQSVLHFHYPPKMGDLKNREISLFDEIPIERTCTDAGIEPHWCTCLNWQEINATEPIVQFIADSLVEAINKETEHERKLCSKVKLSRVEKASKYAPAKAVLSYKTAKDKDGFVPDLTGNSQVQIEYYQLDVWTSPGDAHYEAMAVWDRINNELVIDLDIVSHVNKYGDKPHCIIDKDYFLAKWCVCYDKI